jgi:hypothetical protein
MEQFAMKTKVVSLRLTPSEVAQIEAKANAEDRSVANILRLLVRAGLAVDTHQPRAA